MAGSRSSGSSSTRSKRGRGARTLTERKPRKRVGRGQGKGPRVGRPPGKPSAETRAAIVSAAREQFARVGYERATNREVAVGAGVTAAAIYQYFPSKAQLYAAVAAETLEGLMPELRKAAEAAPSARAALAAIVRVQHGIERHVSAARFMANIPIEMQRHPDVAQAMLVQPGNFFELVLDVVRRGIKSGEITRERSERVVAVFIASLIGMSIHGTTIGGSHSEAGVLGLIDLLEGNLFT